MRWQKYITEIRSQLNNEVTKIKQFFPSSQHQKTLTTFIRPELGATPPTLRKIIEPLVNAKICQRPAEKYRKRYQS